MSADDDRRFMTRALELARRGEGLVEPNPMVGCALVQDGRIVGEGWHQQFGGPHAEVHALKAAGEAARGATAYVTLEPCNHSGKTPPCTQSLIAAGVSRVVAACGDPNRAVSGGGFAALAAAGIAVEVGVRGDEADELIAPFAKLIATRRPWIIAKWAMTLDGKLAAHTGDSRWISGEPARAVVHQIRGRVDAILVGRGTAAADDPMLTARPQGARTATRIVLDSQAAISLESQLVRTAAEAPTLIAVGPNAAADKCRELSARGVEVWRAAAADCNARLGELLDELGRRQMTNVLVEGGAGVFGSLVDLDAMDEVHVFVAPRIVGGVDAKSPVGGRGFNALTAAKKLARCCVERCGEDAYVRGRIQRRDDAMTQT